MPKTQVVKWGNSLAVRIPKAVAQDAKVREGDPLVIEVVDNEIRLRGVDDVPTLAELVAQITPENRYTEVLTHSEIGKEVVEW